MSYLDVRETRACEECSHKRIVVVHYLPNADEPFWNKLCEVCRLGRRAARLRATAIKFEERARVLLRKRNNTRRPPNNVRHDQ